MTFTIFIYVPCIPTLVSFYHEWMLNLVKCFLCIYWDHQVIFDFYFVNVIYYIDLHMLNYPCELGMNTRWSRCMIFLCVVEFCLIIFCWEFLHLYSSKLSCTSLIWWYLYLVLVSGRWWIHTTYLGVFLTLWSFGRDWEVLIRILFVCLVEFTCEATWSWTSISREFIIIIKDSVSLLVIHLFKLSSSWLNFCGLYVSKKLFVSSQLSNFGA